ncbi:MAG: histidine kinase [Lachnospiraceae bacterium]|nr:histidine kinase [Lachnospiraceae bacterium]
MKEVKWRCSVETRLIAGFVMVIAVILCSALIMYHRAVAITRESTYEKMDSQANYYMETLDTELGLVRQLQVDFCNNRKLVFLISPNINISTYEKRDGLLTMEENMNIIKEISVIVEDAVLYLPKSEYKISSTDVLKMDSTDFEKIESYVEYTGGAIYYNGENFFMVQSNVDQIRSSELPNYTLIVYFSTSRLQENLAGLNTSENSGTFLYHESSDTLIENSNGKAVGRKILDQLRTENGILPSRQRVNVDGKQYLVFVGGESRMGLFVQYVQEETVMGEMIRFRILVSALFCLMLVMAVLFGFYARNLLHEPIGVMLKAFQRVQEGNWKEKISDRRQDEFQYLYEGFNEMERQMGQMIDQVYIQTNLAQRAQMKQLQAQVAPHFLYNSFFILSRQIKKGDYEGAEKLSGHLGTYFRYLARNEADDVTLAQETEHARSYAAIQRTRFVNRMTIIFEELKESMKELIVPRLILQPLLENAFEHGLENKMRDGLLWVHFEETEEEIWIYVEDNGEEFTQELLEEIQISLERGKEGEITALYNIHRRLQIYFHGRAGLRVSRSSLGGMCAMIWLQRK